MGGQSSSSRGAHDVIAQTASSAAQLPPPTLFVVANALLDELFATPTHKNNDAAVMDDGSTAASHRRPTAMIDAASAPERDEREEEALRESIVHAVYVDLEKIYRCYGERATLHSQQLPGGVAPRNRTTSDMVEDEQFVVATFGQTFAADRRMITFAAALCEGRWAHEEHEEEEEGAVPKALSPSYHERLRDWRRRVYHQFVAIPTLPPRAHHDQPLLSPLVSHPREREQAPEPPSTQQPPRSCELRVVSAQTGRADFASQAAQLLEKEWKSSLDQCYRHGWSSNAVLNQMLRDPPSLVITKGDNSSGPNSSSSSPTVILTVRLVLTPAHGSSQHSSDADESKKGNIMSVGITDGALRPGMPSLCFLYDMENNSIVDPAQSDQSRKTVIAILERLAQLLLFDKDPPQQHQQQQQQHQQASHGNNRILTHYSASAVVPLALLPITRNAHADGGPPPPRQHHLSTVASQQRPPAAAVAVVTVGSIDAKLGAACAKVLTDAFAVDHEYSSVVCTNPSVEPSGPRDANGRKLLVVRVVLVQAGRAWTLPDEPAHVMYAAVADQAPTDKPWLHVFNYNPNVAGNVSPGAPGTRLTIEEVKRRLKE